MNNQWLITFRSVTYAQKAEKRLMSKAIACTMQRTPRELAERGCGYCLRLRAKDVPAAVECLKQGQVLYGKLYALTDSGRPEERQL